MKSVLLYRVFALSEPCETNLPVTPQQASLTPGSGKSVQFAFLCSRPLCTDARTLYGKETVWKGEAQNGSDPFLGRGLTRFCIYWDSCPWKSTSERCEMAIALGTSNALKHTFFKGDKRDPWPLWESPEIQPYRLSSFSMIRLYRSSSFSRDCW